MTRKTRTAKPQNIAESMRAAHELWGLSFTLMRAAKARGCPAFKSGRVNRVQLMRWVRANPRAVAEAEQATRQKAGFDELRRQKLQAEVALLKSKHKRLIASYILIEVAREVWAECEAICFESAVDLLDLDMFRILKERCQSRLQAPLARLQSPADGC